MEKVVIQKTKNRPDLIDWTQAQKVAEAELGVPSAITQRVKDAGNKVARVETRSMVRH
jgi:hypothetical protein